MISLIYDVTMNGKLRIDYSPSKSPTNEFIYGFRLHHSTEYTQPQIFQEIETVIKNNQITWITRVQLTFRTPITKKPSIKFLF
jgi:retron-type reverse transcriptase